MGYRAAKEGEEKKRKKVKRAVLFALIVLLIAVCVFSFFVPPESWRYYVGVPNLSRRREGELRIHFLDVGQGDSTLVELPDGKVALIDGGDTKSASKKKLMRYLNGLEIEKIDYLIVTHTDKDHCGGIEEVFRYKKVVNAYLPNTYEAEDVAYGKAYAAALEEDCEMIKTECALFLSGASASYTFCFLSPRAVEANDGYADESAVLWLEYKGVSALFCADADEGLENRLLQEDGLGLLPMGKGMLEETQILKVAHHGSASSTSKEFLQWVKPKVAVISCGKDNPYGHPASKTLERLEAAGAEVRRTDVEGHIVATIRQSGGYAVEGA